MKFKDYLQALEHFCVNRFSEVLQYQRDLHRIPEIGFEEFKTSRYVTRVLEELGYEIETYSETPTAVLTKYGGENSRPRVSLRSELDALSIQEQTELPHSSEHAGFMHACGHDYHMAAVLGLARFFREQQPDLPGSLLFLFQPAEEPPEGGARRLVEQGILEKMDYILGFHNQPSLEVGKVEIKAGMVSSSITQLTIKLSGSGGHTSRPDLTQDLIYVASALIQNLYSFIKQEFDPREPVSLSFGEIHAGDAHNIIPEQLQLVGTLRITSESRREEMVKRVVEYIQDFCQLYQVRVEVQTNFSSPGVENNPHLVEKIAQFLEKSSYAGKLVWNTRASMGGEDFSFYTSRIPGVLLAIGSRLSEGTGTGLHRPDFTIDDTFLIHALKILGIALYALLRS